MTRKQEIISALKAEYPEIRTGGGDVYETLSPTDYEKAISDWADVQLEAEVKAEQVLANAEARTALLTRLGITAEEAALLLGGTN
jgi:hypothetical protein